VMLEALGRRVRASSLHDHELVNEICCTENRTAPLEVHHLTVYFPSVSPKIVLSGRFSENRADEWAGRRGGTWSSRSLFCSPSLASYRANCEPKHPNE
jgi:hypothetical protein